MSLKEKIPSKPAVVRRTTVRNLGIFLDGPALDRATKRMGRRIDLKGLVKCVSHGLTPSLLRYYTLIPNEDDSRHRAFLNAVSGAGFELIIKRLPPKGATRQVTIDIEVAADIVAFSQNLRNLPHSDFGDNVLYTTGVTVTSKKSSSGQENTGQTTLDNEKDDSESVALRAASTKPALVLVCPSRDLVHPLQILAEHHIDVTVADFVAPGSSELMRVCKKWIDLSDASGIWI